MAVAALLGVRHIVAVKPMKRMLLKLNHGVAPEEFTQVHMQKMYEAILLKDALDKWLIEHMWLKERLTPRDKCETPDGQ